MVEPLLPVALAVVADAVDVPPLAVAEVLEGPDDELEPAAAFVVDDATGMDAPEEEDID